ncbi:MAG: twin-arginine translocation signal domain-containing protein [Boseongicola sp. SB0677_bin_26]|nr:twin-arginine translocation signal domain-containing protein [Boseongicola sp. SB0677_bin_26]
MAKSQDMIERRSVLGGLAALGGLAGAGTFISVTPGRAADTRKIRQGCREQRVACGE